MSLLQQVSPDHDVVEAAPHQVLEVVTSLAPQEGDLAAYQNTPLSGTLVFTTEGDGSQAFMSEVPSVIKRPRRPARYRAPPAESEPEEPLQTPSVQSGGSASSPISSFVSTAPEATPDPINTKSPREVRFSPVIPRQTPQYYANAPANPAPRPPPPVKTPTEIDNWRSDVEHHRHPSRGLSGIGTELHGYNISEAVLPDIDLEAYLANPSYFSRLISKFRHPPPPPKLEIIGIQKPNKSGKEPDTDSYKFFDPSDPAVHVTGDWFVRKGGASGMLTTYIHPALNKDTGRVHIIKSTSRIVSGGDKQIGKVLLNEWKVLNDIRRAKKGKVPYLLGPSEDVETWAWRDENALYHVTDFCPGGTLGDWIGKIGENRMKLVIAECVIGLQALHSMGIVHHDMKPKNIFIHADGHIRISDFGASQYKPKGKPLSRKQHDDRLIADSDYWAPDMMVYDARNTAYYDEAVDYYSLGAMMFHLNTGRPLHPVYDYNDADKVRFTRRGPVDAWWLLRGTENFRDFVSKLLLCDPCKRLKGKAIEKHPWMTEFKGKWGVMKAMRMRGPFSDKDSSDGLEKMCLIRGPKPPRFLPGTPPEDLAPSQANRVPSPNTNYGSSESAPSSPSMHPPVVPEMTAPIPGVLKYNPQTNPPTAMIEATSEGQAVHQYVTELAEAAFNHDLMPRDIGIHVFVPKDPVPATAIAQNKKPNAPILEGVPSLDVVEETKRRINAIWMKTKASEPNFPRHHIVQLLVPQPSGRPPVVIPLLDDLGVEEGGALPHGVYEISTGLRVAPFSDDILAGFIMPSRAGSPQMAGTTRASRIVPAPITPAEHHAWLVAQGHALDLSKLAIKLGFDLVESRDMEVAWAVMHPQGSS